MALATATALAAASLAATVGGSALQAHGQIQAGKAADSAYRAQAAELEITATIREQENHETILRMRSEARRYMALQRATLAASGTDIASGSNDDVLGVASTHLELQIAEEARRGTLEARSLRYKGRSQRHRGAVARYTSRINALSSVVSGAGTLAKDAYEFQQAGAL